MLLKEKLEDQGVKKVELDRSMTEKKLELMKVLQVKLAGVGRTDDKLDREIAAAGELVAAWRAQDDANRPKAKRAQALNVVQP